MRTLSEKKIRALIAAEKPFEGQLAGGSLYIRVREYLPYICTATHAGHRLRAELKGKCRLGGPDRRAMEEPFTDVLLDPFPVVITAKDSPLEYDLDLPPESPVEDRPDSPETYRPALTLRQVKDSELRHRRFYRVFQALAEALEKKFGELLIVQLRGQSQNDAVFTLGPGALDPKRWRRLGELLYKGLSHIRLPNLSTTVERSDVRGGEGFFVTNARNRLPGAQVVSLGVKKIYMDPETGDPFPLVIESLQEGLHQAVLDAAAHFGRRLDRSRLKRADLTVSHLDAAVLKVDRALFRLARKVDTLLYVNPVNILQEKKRFLARRGYEPVFRYRQLRIDPYDFREKLYKLPVSNINDPLLRGIYRSVVDSYATKIEMLTRVGTPQFHYNSLRYYGEPSSADMANARFILHAPGLPGEAVKSETMDAGRVKERFEAAARDWNIHCKVILSTRIVAKAMVDNSRKAVLINKKARFTETDTRALIHHELGVHMLTTVNAGAQSLRFLTLGLPGNTYTQEGLAILGEYLSGNLTLLRLKTLALRVMAVEMMVKGMRFTSVFARLVGEYGVGREEAFTITARAFRGGGFTKDYLYLRGFRDMVVLHGKRPVLPLFTGKTSSLFLESIEELIQREVLSPPELLPQAFTKPPAFNTPVLDYLIRAIK